MTLVALIGPMGAGKTTIGRRLAEQLGVAFVDSDAEIESRCGADIPWIFDVEGEEGFRRREVAVIDDLTRPSEGVIATGGGVVMREENRAHLSQRTRVIYLHASVDQQLQRTRKSKKRPLLQTEDPRARLESLFEVRDPLYRAIADQVVETDGQSVAAIARRIYSDLRRDA